MKKLLIVLFACLFLITLVSAETFQQKTEVDFKKTCTYNGTTCSSSANCNVSIKYPNSTYVIKTGVMTNSDLGMFNYSLSNSQTNILGEHTWDMFCCDGASCDEAHGTFTITKTGVELTQDKAMVYLGLLAILIFIFIVNFGAISFLPTKDKTDDGGLIMSINKLKYVRAILLVLGWALLIAILFTSSNVAYLYLETTMMGNLLFALYKTMAVLSVPMVIIWFIWIFHSIFQDKETKNMIERGVAIQGEP